jgi:hypothetical protein
MRLRQVTRVALPYTRPRHPFSSEIPNVGLGTQTSWPESLRYQLSILILLQRMQRAEWRSSWLMLRFILDLYTSGATLRFLQMMWR